ncbi:hypothetical protein [Calothrix sp. NIES-3974]|uniref:hypothetical protein n=1 Tax=Calothrix sp. NIES-3974 TaxID=2005462 RepID=UPI000B5EC30C|nr:hypothetical protein [Calothrix sp. NIES-3974]BAZ03411.1 hypothetical protein NIES3974_00370 [Calothrix sp. NIES-3974]
MKTDYRNNSKVATKVAVATKPGKKQFSICNVLLGVSAFGVFVSSSTILCSSVIDSLAEFPFGGNSLYEYEKPEFHRTSIPWLQNRADCEHTSRTWEGGKCWDGEHDPTF